LEALTGVELLIATVAGTVSFIRVTVEVVEILPAASDIMAVTVMGPSSAWL
jgi:hypothetical protein